MCFHSQISPSRGESIQPRQVLRGTQTKGLARVCVFPFVRPDPKWYAGSAGQKAKLSRRKNVVNGWLSLPPFGGEVWGWSVEGMKLASHRLICFIQVFRVHTWVCRNMHCPNVEDVRCCVACVVCKACTLIGIASLREDSQFKWTRQRVENG